MKLCKLDADRGECTQITHANAPVLLQRFGAMIIAGAMCCISSAQAETDCTNAEQQRAVDSLVLASGSWPALRAHQQAWGHCDDGELAEGYSDAVVHLLAQSKAPWPELQQQVRRSPSFAAWVLKHVDASASSDELRQIMQNTAACTRREAANALCAHVRRAAQAAVADLAAAGPGR